MTNAASKRARQKAERRASIVEAAARIFAERGARATTMDDVALAANVSKGTLYLYFSSKDELFVAMTHRPLDEVLRRFEQLVEEDLDGMALLEQLVRVHASVVQAHATQMRVAFASFCGEFAPDPETPSLRDYGQRVERLRLTYIGAIERGMADGTMRPDLVPDEVAVGLWAALFGASFVRMNADRFRARIQAPRALEELDTVHLSVMRLIFSAIERRES